MRKKIKLLPVLLAVLLLLPGRSTQKHTETALLLDTAVTITIYGSKDIAQKALDASFYEIARLETLLGADEGDNDLAALRENAGKSYVAVSDEVLYVLKTALYYAKLSGGVFDPTIGPLVSLWDVSGGGYVPTDKEREAAMALVDYRDVLIDEEGRVMLAREGMEINLGAIAKGYIADKVKALLIGMGVSHATINLGGNVLAVGGKTRREPFVIGIQDPKGQTGSVLVSAESVDRSLVTSGDYERFFERDGVRYHHILDPFTGAPADSGLSGVTIVSDVSIDGDALSTVVFILGRDKGLALIESLDGIDGVLIDNADNVTVSSGLEGKLTFY